MMVNRIVAACVALKFEPSAFAGAGTDRCAGSHGQRDNAAVAGREPSAFPYLIEERAVRVLFESWGDHPDAVYAAKIRRLTHTTEHLKLRFVRLNQLFVVGVLTYRAIDAIKSWYLTKPDALDPS